MILSHTDSSMYVGLIGWWLTGHTIPAILQYCLIVSSRSKFSPRLSILFLHHTHETNEDPRRNIYRFEFAGSMRDIRRTENPQGNRNDKPNLNLLGRAERIFLENEARTRQIKWWNNAPDMGLIRGINSSFIFEWKDKFLSHFHFIQSEIKAISFLWDTILNENHRVDQD